MTTQTKQGGRADQPTLRDSRFARVTVDFAFKRIFGTERFKDATINLLRSILPDAGIEDVKFLNFSIEGLTGRSTRSSRRANAPGSRKRKSRRDTRDSKEDEGAGCFYNHNR